MIQAQLQVILLPGTIMCQETCATDERQRD